MSTTALIRSDQFIEHDKFPIRRTDLIHGMHEITQIKVPIRLSLWLLITTPPTWAGSCTIARGCCTRGWEGSMIVFDDVAIPLDDFYVISPSEARCPTFAYSICATASNGVDRTLQRA
ncbi:MAG: hypothetical protein WD316_12900 [Phycisphaeraceae bacterium]